MEHGPLVGILGGMGPAATADFYAKLIAATPAQSDQEHVRVVIWADPTVPDRSRAVKGEGDDPTQSLVLGARRLKEAGAAFYVVTCNSAHAFLPEVRRRVDLDYVSMIEATCDRVTEFPSVKGVGLLATDATLTTELYQRGLEDAGIRTVTPTVDDQRVVMETIYAVKAGKLTAEQRSRLAHVAQALIHNGAEMIVAACTEIPLALNEDLVSVPVIDPSLVLAECVVEKVSRPPYVKQRPDH